MKKIIRLTESDLVRIVKRVIMENPIDMNKTVGLAGVKGDTVKDVVTSLQRGDNKKCFTGMKFHKGHDYSYKKIPQNFHKEVNGDLYIYYKGTDWTSGKGNLISGEDIVKEKQIGPSKGEKFFDWTCKDGKLTITNMSKEWKRVNPY